MKKTLKKIVFILALTQAQVPVNAQNIPPWGFHDIPELIPLPSKVIFEYDDAGNQISRELCIPGLYISKKKNLKETDSITDEDLEKFFPEDVLSYYPNPVREELYLKWELSDGNYVKKLQLSSFNGQAIQTYYQSEHDNSLIIPFQSYPAGVYLIVLEYSNGDQKTIKIIKK